MVKKKNRILKNDKKNMYQSKIKRKKNGNICVCVVEFCGKKYYSEVLKFCIMGNVFKRV